MDGGWKWDVSNNFYWQVDFFTFLNHIAMRNPFLLLLFTMLTFCCAKVANAQLVDQVLGKVVETAVEEIPTILLDESDLNDPGGAIDTTMDWTAIWRSSDVDSSGGRYRYGAADWETRPRGKRTGCICMDGTEDDHKGRGACSGHGGVRYWVHELPDGKEVHHATNRHFRHPEPLTKDEKLVLAANNEEEDKPAGNRFGKRDVMDSFVNLAIILASSTMVIYYMRQIMAPKRKGRRKKPTAPTKKGRRAAAAQPDEDGSDVASDE